MINPSGHAASEARLAGFTSIREVSSRGRKLDNTAIIFPSVATKADTNAYRLTATLRGGIDETLLQEAAGDVLPHFDAFSVGMSADSFNRYHKRTNKTVYVCKDAGSPCSFIDPTVQGEPLFRVLHSESSIHLEAFHSLTDGVGASRFLKAVAYRYCQLAYPDEFSSDTRNHLFGIEHAGLPADGYDHVYLQATRLQAAKGQARAALYDKPVFHFHEKRIETTDQQVRTEMFSVEAIKAACRRYGVTLGVYLTSVIAHAIYLGSDIPKESSIGIAVPVNLRSVFEFDSALNFFSSILVHVSAECLWSFEETVAEVQRQFMEKGTKSNFERAIVHTVEIENSTFARSMPLFVKDAFLKLAYRATKKKRTLTYSNLGVFAVDSQFERYFEGFGALPSPSFGEPLRIATCTYKDTLSLSCISRIPSDSVMNPLIWLLRED